MFSNRPHLGIMSSLTETCQGRMVAVLELHTRCQEPLPSGLFGQQRQTEDPELRKELIPLSSNHDALRHLDV